MTPSNAASSSSGHASDYDDTNKEDCISCFTGKETVKASNVDSPTVSAAAPWVACMNRLLARSLLCMGVSLTSHVPFVSMIVYSSVRHGYQHRSASGSVRCHADAFACQSSIVTTAEHTNSSPCICYILICSNRNFSNFCAYFGR